MSKGQKDTRERLATLETRQETLEGKADDLKDGQSDILDKLDDLDEQFVDESTMEQTRERLEKVEEQTGENTQTRQRAYATAKMTILVLTLSAGFSGAVVALI